MTRPPFPIARGRALALAGLALCAAVSCGGDASGPRTDIARVARDSKARLDAAAAAAVRFRPPADGVLTDAMLDRFVRVRRAAKGRGDAEAARAIGADPDEVAWVRARVDEALIEADARRVRAASDEVYGRTLASLRETRRSVKDAPTARSIDEQIAGLERERAALRRPSSVSASVAANARKVAARRAEIEGPPGQ